MDKWQVAYPSRPQTQSDPARAPQNATPPRPQQPAPMESPRQNRASVKLETRGHTPSKKHVRAPSVPTWLPSSFGDLRVKTGAKSEKTAWTDKHKAELAAFLTMLEEPKADKTKILAAAQALVKHTKKLVPGLSAVAKEEIAALTADKRKNIVLRVAELLEGKRIEKASPDVRTLLDSIASIATDPVLEARLTETVNRLMSPGEDLPAVFDTLIELTKERNAMSTTPQDTRFLHKIPLFAFLDERIEAALAGKEPKELLSLFDNLALLQTSDRTGILIFAGIMDKLGPTIAQPVADGLVDQVASKNSLENRTAERRFLYLQHCCDDYQIDFARFMDPAVDKALARRLGSLDELQDLQKNASLLEDRSGSYLQTRLENSSWRLRPERGAGAAWRFMQALHSNDPEAKKNAFYGTAESEGLHPLIQSRMKGHGPMQASIDEEELTDWIDRAVMDHPDANLIAIVGALDDPFGASGYIFDRVKVTLHNGLTHHVLTEQFVRSVLAKGADVEGSITSLATAGVAFDQGELDRLLAVAVRKLDRESLDVLRARVAGPDLEALRREPTMQALQRLLN